MTYRQVKNEIKKLVIEKGLNNTLTRYITEQVLHIQIWIMP